MTTIAQRKSALNVVSSAAKRERRQLREIVLEFDPAGYTLNVRLKGTRNRLPISIEAIYDAAAKLAARRVIAEKLATRKARKGGR